MNDHDDDIRDDAGDREGEEKEERFEDLFESYMAEMKDDLRIGEQITGEIIAITDENIFLNTGTKIDGVVDKAEFIDENGALPFHIGDQMTLYVVSKDESEIRLSKAMTSEGGINQLYDAHRNSVPVEGKVRETCKGGVRVNIMGRTAFCPVSQIDVAYVENPEEYVGGTYEFLITRIEEKGRNIVVSRRELLNRYIAEQRKEFLQSVNPGDIVDGRVTKLMPYGAFVELAPGVEGMVHISELNWSRVESPEEVVAAKDPVQVKILSIEANKDAEKPPKISLSMKQAAGDPWQNIADKFKHGDKVEGKVTRCADFGAFVEIAPGIEGLVHISEMSYRKRILKPDDEVSPGEAVAVMIKSIDTENRRISLSMKDAEGDPWLNIENRYPAGRKVTGNIEKKESFGYFITLEPGIVGLLPISKINASPAVKEIEKLKVDDPITVTIEAVKPAERKISLDAADAADKTEWRSYSEASEKSTGMGDLGEKLKEALKSKK